MARRLIDISVPLQNDVPADPPGGHPTIQYIDHQQGMPRMLQFFQGLKAEDLPDGQGWAVEQVQISTHNGTHLDAPWHFHPTMNRGERSWTIDEVPLEWCLQPVSNWIFVICRMAMWRPQKMSRTSSSASVTRCRRWRSWWSTPAPARNSAGRITSPPAAAWAMRRRCICWSAACG